MAATQTVLFTVMPRGVSVNGATLPVSVVVSPRLVGANRLDAFPDWVDWTQKLSAGAQFVFACGARTATVPIATAPLRPDLWRALFEADTFVRSRAFDDYSSHGVLSFSVRESLSALKAVYQEAGVVLALPDAPDDVDPNDPEQEPGARRAGARRHEPAATGRDPRAASTSTGTQRKREALARPRAPSQHRRHGRRARSTARSTARASSRGAQPGCVPGHRRPVQRVPPHADAHREGGGPGGGRSQRASTSTRR